MKKLLLLLLCVPLIFSCGENEKKKEIENEKKKEIKNDLTRQNLKGKVKSTTKTILHKWNSYLDSIVVQFNKDGNMTDSSSYDKYGVLKEKCIYKYDKDGNKTEYSQYNADGELDGKYKYEYNEDGEITMYDNGPNKKSKAEYIYDKKRNWIERTYSENDKQITIIKREIEYYE